MARALGLFVAYGLLVGLAIGVTLFAYSLFGPFGLLIAVPCFFGLMAFAEEHFD